MTLLLSLFLGQAAVPAAQTINLDSLTRPAVEIDLFRKMKAITVSEYFGQAAGPNEKVLVYRYTYKRPYKAERKRWETLFTAKDGWKIEEESEYMMIIARPMNHAKLREQALILHPGRITFNKSSPARTKVVKDPAWVRVSLNEMFKR